MKKNATSIKKNTSVFFKVLKYLKGYLALFIISIILTLAVVALTLYVPILIGQAIDLSLGKDNVDITQIGKILTKIAFCIGFTAVFQWIINVINNRMVYGIVRNVRHEAFVKIQSFPVSFIDSHRSGDIVNRLIADSDQFSDGLLMGFSQFFNGVMTIFGTIVFMFMISVPVTFIVILITPLSLFVASFIAKRTFNLFKKQSEIRSEQTALIDEMIGEHKTVVAFGYEEKAQERFDEINNRLEKTSLKAIFFSSLTNPSTRFVNATVYAFVAFAGAMICANFGGEVLKVGMLSSFLSYATQYTKPFNEISGVLTELQNALASAARVFELIESPSELEVEENEAKIENAEIEFCDVSFSYVPEKPLISNFNFKAEAGQHIAIVGPTGCGKTTLINLLMRFYDVNDGAIKLGGVDIRSIERGELRKKYGMVLQETWLSDGSIKENIAYGKPDATDEDIIAAAKAAHAHSFIKRLPDGYNTLIGDGATSLSQGQRQLLCIARIMLCEPEILILDEATSSIDTRTEIRIQKAFKTAMQGKTAFIVAHRLSTIKDCDVILVMNTGNIVEQGSHAELLAKKGFYYNLYNSQFPEV
ncbi:MAG: ABC transporter ATP-binding protein [Ruminococcaceae bacterium]|nr:ABC transporter ATP-binding protein [Oscillospiraceae bacterium]